MLSDCRQINGAEWDEEEGRLVQRARRGDEEALDGLIVRHRGDLVAYASRVLGDPVLAEDVVQAVFIRLWQDDRPAPRSVRSFLFRMTRNVALDELRSRRARAAREQRVSAEGPTTAPSPAELLEERRLAMRVEIAIQGLPSRRREAFTLAYLENQSYSQVAEAMSLSTKTVGHHVSAALAELRDRLEPLRRARSRCPR